MGQKQCTHRRTQTDDLEQQNIKELIPLFQLKSGKIGFENEW